MSSSIKVSLLPALLAALNGIALAQFPEDKIVADDAASSDYFGRSVAISGNYAIVGAPFDDDGGSGSGSAYIFKRDGTDWNQEDKIVATDAAADDYFGNSVAISGDYAIVGARGVADGGYLSGAAYIFKRDGTSWDQEDKIVATDPAANDLFGWSVSIDGNYAVVGARGDDDGGSASGSAYIFKRDGTSWDQEDKITAEDAAADDYFGRFVSIDGDYAIVSAYLEGVGGSAYIFKRDGTDWSQEDKITAEDAANSDDFGYSVSISGDYAIVGAYHDNDGGTSSGSAYIFKRDGTDWSQEDKIVATDPAASDFFGISVSISGDYAIVGAYRDDDGDYDTGSAYIFKRDGTSWNQTSKIVASDAASGDYLGNSVSIDGDYAIVGADQDDDEGSQSGSAYIYSIKTPTFQPVSLAADNSTIAVTLSEAVYSTSSGSGDLDASDFVLSISGGWATLTSATPTSISKSGNVYTLGIGLSGIANSNEVLILNPAENAIYDADGNAVLTTQKFNSVNLNQKVLTEVASLGGGGNTHHDYNSLVKVDDDTYALAYGNGNISTYTINSDGSSISQVASLRHDTESNAGRYNSLVRVDEDTYALAYQGKNYDGYIKTFTIPADGSSITEVASLEHDTEGGYGNSLVKLNADTYALAYRSSSSSNSVITTFTISADGSSITEVASLEHDTHYSGDHSLVKMDHNTLVLAYQSSAQTCMIKTFAISSDGSSIIQVGGRYLGKGQYSSLVQVDNDTYAVATSGQGKGNINTFTVSADGSSITSVATLMHDDTRGGYFEFTSQAQFKDLPPGPYGGP